MDADEQPRIEPRVEPIKNGWHALAPGLAVRGDSEDDAREKFRAAVARDAELRARDPRDR
jgi:hypothetical protein